MLSRSDRAFPGESLCAFGGSSRVARRETSQREVWRKRGKLTLMITSFSVIFALQTAIASCCSRMKNARVRDGAVSRVT